MRRSAAIIILTSLLLASATPIATAQQPDIIQEHWYHSYLTLTEDVQAWADENPEIVRLVNAGQTLHGRNQWVV